MNFDEVIEDISMVLLQKIKKEFLKLEVAHSGEQNYTKPTLAIITASYDEASKIYVRNKIKTAEEVEIEVHHFDLDIETRTTEDICNLIKSLDKLGYTGIMVQLPLADKFDEKTIIESIPYDKDVDGLTARQRIMLEDNDDETLVPCTALACYLLIAFDKLARETVYSFSEMVDRLLTTDLSGIDIVVVNRSKLIGIPLSKLLRNKNATVTVAHSKSRTDVNCLFIENYYDYIVTGIGKPIIKDSRIDDSQTFIDCGIMRDEFGKIKRDLIQGEENKGGYNYYGAVGKLTVVMLMYNTLRAYKMQNNYEDE